MKNGKLIEYSVVKKPRRRLRHRHNIKWKSY